MISDTPRMVLVESSKLKLSATARLAEGGKDAKYEASVIFHAAARAELRALFATEAPDAITRLRSAIERCGCLLDGLDPSTVLESAWGDVLEASAHVPEPNMKALRARIDPHLTAFLATYERTLSATPKLKTWMMEGGIRPAQLGSLGRDVDKVLAAFPGDPRFWALRSRAHLDANEVANAWDAIRRARSLSPEDTSIRLGELILLPIARPVAEAQHVLDAVFDEVERGDANADVCFGFIAATIELAERSNQRQKLLLRALDAATMGFALPTSWPLDRKMLRAMQLVLREILAGRKPGLEILYRCGLGAWAARAPRKADPLAILTQGMSSHRFHQAA